MQPSICSTSIVSTRGFGGDTQVAPPEPIGEAIEPSERQEKVLEKEDPSVARTLPAMQTISMHSFRARAKDTEQELLVRVLEEELTQKTEMATL